MRVKKIICFVFTILTVIFIMRQRDKNMEIKDDELEQATGGAYQTSSRTATNEECEVCGGNKFTLYIGSGGRATCQKCGHGQIILEWFYS